MSNMLIYKPRGATYDLFNQRLSQQLAGLRAENNPDYNYSDHEHKALSPYDVFVGPPTDTSFGLSGVGVDKAIEKAGQEAVSSPGGTSVAPSGSIQELAKRIVDHPNITFDPPGTTQAPAQFQALSEGRPVQTGGGPGISSNLLGIIIGIADKFPIQISSYIRPEAGPAGHGAGRAVDIDGTDHSLGINGSDARSNKIVEAAISFIPDNGAFKLGFGRGNRTTPLSSIPGGGTKGTYDFDDNANHVHIQIDE
jgi:hypothetical protein